MKNYLKSNWSFLLILAIALFLRIVNLGYSDYQGDEIKALFIPAPGQTQWDFLLDQRKGPVQFIITGLLALFDPHFESQFLMRLPFAVAGFLAVLFFYKLVELHFGKRVAFYASFFFATNGFIVGLSRIVQYQPVGMLFMVLTLYFLSKAVQDERYRVKGIYYSLFSWTVAILTHYDGLFIAPFVFYLLYQWFRKEKPAFAGKIQHFIASGLISAAALAVFYIPFALKLSQSTVSYWSARISEEESGKLYSSRLLFTLYQPIYVFDIYTILLALGLLFLGMTFLVHRFGTEGLKARLPESLGSKTFLNILFLLIWIALPVIFMELIVYNPGTHIYTYLIPGFILLGYGVFAIEYLLRQVLGANPGRAVNLLGVFAVFSFIFAESYAIYVDHAMEYPWENERFFAWTFYKPSSELHRTYHLAVFGFPYYRNWEAIEAFTSENPVGSYSTNERRTIARFYVHLVEEEDSPLASTRYYISINNAQSFLVALNPRMQALTELYDPVYRYADKGEPQAEIFVVTPEIIADLTEKGY